MMSLAPTAVPGTATQPARAALLLLVGSLATPLAAEPRALEQDGGLPTVDVPRALGSIEIDGHLEEPEWREAVSIPLLWEVFPGENSDPPVATEMLVLHDETRLYVGFKAFDPDPQAIRAHVTDRDGAFSNDIVGITIDPFNDGRRAFEFWANPLGVQMDLFFDDVGGNEDSSWDAIWHSAGHINGDGYVVEMAIPFYSLRFPKTPGEQTWGFDGIRFYPRDQRRSFRSQPRNYDLDCYICQFSKMRGFEEADPGLNLEINPTLTARGSESRQTLGDPGFGPSETDTDPGLDVRWGFTPNLTVSATLNPDFSQVEADVGQLDVNTQFALFFPEKRPFFLEGADFFDTPFDVVHTRTVADPDWGLKLTGKEGRHGVGVFAATDTGTTILLPGRLGSDLAFLDEESTAAVVRYRRDIGQRSAIGFIATDRDAGGYFNRVAGVDGLLRFTQSDSVRFQLLGSRTRYPEAIAQEHGLGVDDLEDHAYRLGYDHRTRDWVIYARHDSIGDGFRADMGFMPQVGTRFFLGGAERIFWGDDDDRWTRIRVGADWDRTEGQDGLELEQELEGWFNISGPRQSFLNLRYGRRSRFFGDRTFEESFRNFYFEIRPSGDLFFGLFVRSGDQIDFANVQPGEQLLIEPEIVLNLGRHLRADLSFTRERLDVAAGRLFSADLGELRLTYQLNIRTFVRLITQHFNIDRDPGLFTGDVDARAQRLFNQLLFSYKLNPRTVLFAGYSDNHRADDTIGLTQENRTVFLKLGYAWTL